MNNDKTLCSQLLTEQEAAKRLGLSRYTMQQWRFRGRGPVYIKLGGKAIRYSKNAIDDFIGSCVVEPVNR